MSIFRSTFKPFVIRQLNARQYILQQGDNATSRSIRIQQYTTSKSPWVKMTSFVDYDNPPKYTGDQLARKYILKGGTLLPQSGSFEGFAIRNGVGNRGGSYGSDLGNRQLGLRPMPGITSVNVKSKGTYGSLEEATVVFYAWDKAQLDELEILFMRPGYPVLLEWGWSMYLDTTPSNPDTYDTETDAKSVDIKENDIRTILEKNSYMKSFDQPTINPFDTSKTQQDIYDDINRLKHKFSGNYDGLMGLIRNFTWKSMPNGGFECTVVLISVGDILSSLKINRGIGDLTINDQETQDKAGYNTNFTKILDSLITKDDKDKTDIRSISLIKQELKDENLYDFTVRRIKDIKRDTKAEGSNQASKPSDFSYIQFALFIHIVNKYFNLYDDKKNPFIEIELPVYKPSNIGNGLCLASRDSVSINPRVCILKNSKAEFVTGKPGIGYDYGKASGNSGFFIKDYLYTNTTLGVIGNLYVNLNYIKDKFETIIANDKKGEVTVYTFIKQILDDMSKSLGNINEFDVFVYNNKAVIIDKNYVELPENTNKNLKYRMNLFGNNSVVRNYDAVSKIFQSQANMIAVAAQDRENVTSVQNSTYTYLNKGLKSRIYRSLKELENVDNGDSSSDIQKEKEVTARTVLELQKYLSIFLDKNTRLPSTDSAIPTAETLLNSILLKVNTDANYKAIIPISLDVTLDGISGIFPNQIFTVNPDILPSEWSRKSLGFIVTGVEHNIVRSDWTTTLRTQTVILDQEKVQQQAIKISEDKRKDILFGVSSLIENIRNKNSQVGDAYNRLLYFIKAYFENRINVNVLFDVIIEREKFIKLQKYKILSLSSDISTENVFNTINDLNIVTSDLTNIFKKISEYSDSNFSKMFDVDTDFPSATTYEQKQKLILDIQKRAKEGIRKSISILNPMLSFNNVDIRSDISTLNENLNIILLLKNIITLTKDWQSLPQNAKDLLNKDIDKVYNDIIISRESSELREKNVILNTFGEYVQLVVDGSSTKIVIENLLR